MGRKIYDEDLRLNLILNGQGLSQGSRLMVAELGKMELKMIGLEQTAKKLATEIKLLEKDEIRNAVRLAAARKEYNDTTLAIRAQVTAIEKLRQQVGLTGMTVQQLRNHAKALQVQLNNMTGNPALRQRLLSELQATNVRINTLTTGASRLSQAWERMERTATRAGSILGMFTMVIYSIVRVVTNVISRMKDLEDLMGTVRKNTGLAVGEVWEMKEAFDAWDTRTKTDDLLKLAIVAGKLGIQGKTSVMDFVESANMIQIALGDDLDGSVEDTVNSLGKLMNAFRVDKEMPINEAMLRTGGVLNELAKSSAASAGTILNYMTRLSSVGELAGFTIAQIGGIGSALDAMNVPSERGATAVQKIMLALANPKKIHDFADALGLSAEGYKKMLRDDPNKAMIDLLRKFVSTKNGLVELTGGMKDFGAKGQYMTAVIGSMAQNLDVLAAQQKIAEDQWKNKIAGASVLEEYIIMNNNFTANVLKQQKIIKATTDQMNKDAEPAVLNLVTAWTKFVVGIKAATDWIGKHWTAIKLLTLAYIAYKVPAMWRISNLIMEELLVKKAIVQETLRIFWMKATILWTRNLSVAQIALTNQSNFLRIANLALTQGFRAAIVEMRLLRAASNMIFPVAAGIAAAIALGAAIYWLTIRRRDLTEEEKRHIALQKAIQTDYIKEKGTLDVMIDRLKDVNTSQGERSKIMKTLKDQYGDYLPLLMKEGVTADEVAGSYDKIVEAMGKKIIFDKATEAGVVNRSAFAANEAEIKRMELLMKKHQDATEQAKSLGVTRNIQLDADLKADYIRVLMGLKKLRFTYTDEYAKLKSDMAGSAAPEKIKVVPVGMESKDEAFETFKQRQENMKDALAQEELEINARALRMNTKKETEDEELRKAKIRYLQKSIEDRRTSWRTEEGEEAAYVAAQKELIALQRDKQLDAAKEDKKDGKESVKDAKEFAQELIDVEKLRIGTITGEREKAIAEEEDRNQQSMAKNWKNDEALEYETLAHNQNITDINLKFLDKQFADKSVSDATRRLMLEEFHNKELISDEQYWTSKAALAKESEEKLLEFQKKYSLLSMEELIAIEIDEFKKSEEYALLSEEKKQKGLEEIQLKYGRARAKNQKKNIEDELNAIKAKFTNEQQITFERGEKIQDIAQRMGQGMGDAFVSMFDKSQNAFAVFSKNMLLLAIEEVRAFIRLQYVKMLASNVLKYNAAGIAVTAGEIMLIEAAFGVAAGLVGTINTAKTKQKAEGSYPVIGADDGRLYHAVNGGTPATGVYNRPTLLNMSDGRSLVGERAPELVVDGDTFRRIQLNAPEILQDIYAYAGRGPSRTRQKAEGSYPAEMTNGRSGEMTPTRNNEDANNGKLIAAINRLNAHLDKGLRTSINKYGRNGLSDAMDDIKNFNAKVYKK